MRILGVDPGLDTTGYGIIDEKKTGFKLVEAGIIKTSPNQPIQKRLKNIHLGLLGLIKKYKPKTLVLEKLYSHYRHPVTAILMGHSRGVICLLAGEAGMQLVSYPAKKVKKAVTGNGSASKEQVQRMVQGMLGLSDRRIPDHVTDALAIAITHTHANKVALTK